MSSPRAYYNENDPDAANWLEELVREGLVADGVVDRRSILDVEPEDLDGFTQCHFFAGIGGWSRALRLAGWPDSRPVWTGSPPCQPFSPAGKGLSRDDPRHLAPHFIRLVRACSPGMLFGEQTASAAVFGKIARTAAKGPPRPPAWSWLDDLFDRLEAAHYAVGASDIPAAGIGSPQIRQRAYFGAVRMADGGFPRLEGHSGDVSDGREPVRLGPGSDGPTSESGLPRRVAHGNGDRLAKDRDGRAPKRDDGAVRNRSARSLVDGSSGRTSPEEGFWGSPDWLFCRDGFWRPVEPGAFPLADGVPARVGRLRGYGNAIVPQVAAEFITSFDRASARLSQPC